jgi:hypothetical protein
LPAARPRPAIVHTLCDRVHHHFGIELRNRIAAGFDFAAADRSRHVQDLALQVGEVDRIGVDQAELADAGCGQIHRRRRAEAACADDDRVRIEKALLSLDTEFVDEDMAGIAEQLIVVHGGAQK